MTSAHHPTVINKKPVKLESQPLVLAFNLSAREKKPLRYFVTAGRYLIDEGRAEYTFLGADLGQ